jgi:hypothetical protein
MPSMMRFQVPPRADSLNHTPTRHVNNLPLKLIDGKASCSDLVKQYTSLFGDLTAYPLHFTEITSVAGGIICFCIDRWLKASSGSS